MPIILNHQLQEQIPHSSAEFQITYFRDELSSLPIIGLVGCALCGLAVGIMWPGSNSISSQNCPKGGTAMFAFLALAGDLAGKHIPEDVFYRNNADECQWIENSDWRYTKVFELSEKPAKARLVFEDNYFSLLPGEQRTVSFRRSSQAQSKSLEVSGYTATI